jgi:hypothetical protein
LLGNAEVTDGRLLGERSRRSEISPFELSQACRHRRDMRQHEVEGLAVGHCPSAGEVAGAEQRSHDRAKYPQHAAR